MHFDEELPNASPGDRTDEGFRKGNRPMRCVVCQTPTQWFHERICLYFCSRECCEKYRDQQQVDRARLDGPS